MFITLSCRLIIEKLALSGVYEINVNEFYMEKTIVFFLLFVTCGISSCSYVVLEIMLYVLLYCIPSVGGIEY